MKCVIGVTEQKIAKIASAFKNIGKEFLNFRSVFVRFCLFQIFALGVAQLGDKLIIQP